MCHKAFKLGKNRIILAIESSCDETSASIIINGKIKSNIIASQLIHSKFGGVVPELASRAHIKAITVVTKEALGNSNTKINNLSAVAFTQGPGLLGSLLVGTSFAKALSYSLEVPLIAVNHMKAHIFANFIEHPKPDFPFLCLTVSGGHTELTIVHDYFKMEIIGRTQDDALGEAFDKIAKVMGIPYPGGPLIDKYSKAGNPNKFKFPDTNMPKLDFSFSGIKTAFLYFIKDKTEENPNFIKENLSDISASIQNKLVDMVLKKLTKASIQTKIKTIALAGGVASNDYLRSKLEEQAGISKWKLFIPKKEYCTDNAAMIAKYADFQYLAGNFSDLRIVPTPRIA